MKIKFYAIFAALSIGFTTLFALSFFSMRKEILFFKSEAEEKETELVYVYVEITETQSETEEEKWLVKEYEERIGVFDGKGQLLQIIDTYTKTLPMEDRSLLREGIEVNNEADLYSIIEAYSD